MSTAFAVELPVAVDAVRRAAAVCRAVQQSLVSADTLEKEDRSPVTVADFASQAVICHALARAFPGDAIVGEEDAHALREDSRAKLRASVVAHAAAVLGDISEGQVLALIDRGGATPSAATGRFWALDPLDGTKGFLRREQYAIALALIENGCVILGVLACPNLVLPGRSEPGLLMTAASDQPSAVQPLDRADEPTPIHVKSDIDPAGARFCESVESSHSDHSRSGNIAEALGITAAPVRMDSQAKYAVVARGQASIYLRLPTGGEYREKIWDHAAGSIVVEQAGGKVTDSTGKPLDFSRGRVLEGNAGIIATNGPIHQRVVEAVANA